MADTWPGVELDPEVFARRCAELRADEQSDRAELYITLAIEARVVGAAEAFERKYFAGLPAVLTARGATQTEIDEIVQQTRLRLLAPRDDGALPLVQYAGRGQIDGLVRVTAVRAFLNLREKTSREVDQADGWLDDLVAPELEGPGLVALAAAERRDVKQAFAAALGSLASRDRAVLRMHLVNGLGIDPIAKMLGIHRATAARQLTRLKAELVERVRTELAKRWGESEVLARVTSRVDLSLERLLATGIAEP